MTRLPPIAALRALEAAARLNNFTMAAHELNVTQSAISHQVRHLEELWGLKLFDRRPRRLALTRNGQTLAPIVKEFFDNMGATLDALRSGGIRDPLRVNLLQSFAVKWLVPRLSLFHEEHPDIEVWISTSDKLVNFASDDVDVAIRLGLGNYPGLHTTFLLRDYVFPVCRPQFLERVGKPASPADLLSYPLLLRLSEQLVPSWEDWFQAAGVENVILTDGPRFPDTNMALLAAMNGQGIALARSAHVSEDIAAGHLVKLFDVHCPSQVAYYVICPAGKENNCKIAAFREWILRQAAIVQAEYDKDAG